MLEIKKESLLHYKRSGHLIFIDTKDVSAAKLMKYDTVAIQREDDSYEYLVLQQEIITNDNTEVIGLVGLDLVMAMNAMEFIAAFIENDWNGRGDTNGG